MRCKNITDPGYAQDDGSADPRPAEAPAADLAADPLPRVRVDRGLDLRVVPGHTTAPTPPLHDRD
ncbi:hypothetical protein [Streptomyces sp. NPDC057877]|uniref:hypothetical protein n=1 Tax=Streptomyces sp. NPDC057877 TaxID=3346269 RepID=UPI0036A3714E